MLVELTRSNLPSGDWYLCMRGARDGFLVRLPAYFAAKVEGDSAWFEATREGERWCITRFVARLAVDNGPVVARKRQRKASLWA